MSWNRGMGYRSLTAAVLILLTIGAVFILPQMLQSYAKTLASDVARPVLWAITTKAQGATLVAPLPVKESVTVVDKTASFVRRFGDGTMLYNPPDKAVRVISYGPSAYTAPAPVQAKLPWGKCTSLHPYTDTPPPC